MKKAFILLMALILCFSCVFSLVACGNTDNTTTTDDNTEEQPNYDKDGITYTLSDDGGHYIIAFVGNVEGGIVEIPETYNGLPVTEIGKDAFNAKKNGVTIKEVTLPASITELPEGAFGGCTTVEKITLPVGIKSIPVAAFSSCHKLKDLTIPSTVEFVSANAFSGCEKLLKYVNGINYVDNWAINVDGYISPRGTLTFKEGTVGISDGFTTIERINVVLPSTVRYIHSSFERLNPDCLSQTEDGAYYLNNWLYSTDKINSNLPLNVKEGTIGVMATAFKAPLNKLRMLCTEVNIPASVLSIYTVPYATEKITVAEENPNFKSVDGVLYSKDGKELLCYPARKGANPFTVPEGVTKIGKEAFNRALPKEIIFPSSLKEIDEYAFAFSYITSITLPEGITVLKESTFEECVYLESITIPNSLKYIENNVFRGCENLTSISLNEGLMYIGNNVFTRCRKLESLTLPSTLINIGGRGNEIASYANEQKDVIFSTCINLKSIEVASGNTVFTSIDNVLYMDDGKTLILYLSSKNDTEFTVPSGVTTIAAYAFYPTIFASNNNDQLFSIKLPSTLTTIEDYAFLNCQISEITIPASVKSVGVEIVSPCDKIIFEDPNGWRAKDKNSIMIYKVDLSNPEKNVEYFSYQRGGPITINNKFVYVEKWTKS